MDIQLPFESEDHMWGAVENLLDSEGWKGYIVPSLEQTLRTDMIALTNAKRGDLPDDFLRGRIAITTSLLNGIYQKLQEYRDRKSQIEVVGADGQPVHTGDPYGEVNSEDGQPALER